RLLRLPAASPAERAAMVAAPRPGALFVDLDADAAAWNERAGLPAPRMIHVDVEVRSDDIVYNDRGWHDPNGHRFRVTRIRVSGRPEDEDLPADPTSPHEPLFVRAHHGDIIELTLTNQLTSLAADHFDLAQLPVECGLHVHLVKFDVLAADGSATGWNYMSGASCREAVPDVPDTPMSAITSLHRWVVDEEFGPCFFHDHLLANYRQKRGLFAALVAEPPGSRWLDPETQQRTAWTGKNAVVLPGDADRHDPARFEPYREACLAVGDFIPNFDATGRPLNPPGELSGDDDPGVMAVNYRSAPLTTRSKDPSQWFSGPDPETGVIHTHPGDRLRIRLVQGSHEEQHSFVTHGLNWRKEWQNPTSPLVGQVTFGISEAFTLDIGGTGGMPYGLGDHMWRLSGMDDLWLGCWGIVRAVPHDGALPALPGAAEPAPLLRPVNGDGVRCYTVRARRIEHRYDAGRITDPWGLIYERVPDDTIVDAFLPAQREGVWKVSTTMPRPLDDLEPLVLRCHPGEWVHVRLVNEVRLAVDRPEGALDHTDGWSTTRFADENLPPFGPEPHPPALPLDDTRVVSPRVSLHPSLLRYDIVSGDGAHVGRNHDSTAGALPVRPHDLHGGAHGTEHRAGDPVGPGGQALPSVPPVLEQQPPRPDAPGALAAEQPDDPQFRHRAHRGNVQDYWWYADEKLLEGSPHGRVCYLHDMADIRNHRHHGLIGAIVIEPADMLFDEHDGTAAELTVTGARHHERVLFWQDGLRLYLAGNPAMPVPDAEPHVDAEDAGQRGINYRSALLRSSSALSDPRPPTPVWHSPAGEPVVLRLVGACDKPRNHTFTLHGLEWRTAPWLPESPYGSALSGLSADTTHDLAITPVHPGDHAFRSGAFRWSVEQGMWGSLRIEDDPAP
ncbi:hypothetical protein ACFSCY_25530, partial [Pseudonocardia aurantiaca]